MPYLGKSECHQCGREVDVSENRSGMAYYRCAPCGFTVKQSNPRGDRMHRAKVRRFEDPDEAPEPQNPARQPARESRDIPEPPAAPSPPKAAKRGAGSGFFFSGGK